MKWYCIYHLSEIIHGRRSLLYADKNNNTWLEPDGRWVLLNEGWKPDSDFIKLKIKRRL